MENFLSGRSPRSCEPSCGATSLGGSHRWPDSEPTAPRLFPAFSAQRAGWNDESPRSPLRGGNRSAPWNTGLRGRLPRSARRTTGLRTGRGATPDSELPGAGTSGPLSVPRVPLGTSGAGKISAQLLALTPVPPRTPGPGERGNPNPA